MSITDANELKLLASGDEARVMFTSFRAQDDPTTEGSPSPVSAWQRSGPCPTKGSRRLGRQCLLEAANRGWGW